MLLEEGATADLSCKVDQDRTAMFYAVFYNHRLLVELLLHYGEIPKMWRTVLDIDSEGL